VEGRGTSNERFELADEEAEEEREAFSLSTSFDKSYICETK